MVTYNKNIALSTELLYIHVIKLCIGLLLLHCVCLFVIIITTLLLLLTSTYNY